MEGKRHHHLLLLALIFCIAAMPAAEAASVNRRKPTERTTIRIGTGPDGIIIGVHQEIHTPGAPGASHTLPVGDPHYLPPQIGCYADPSTPEAAIIICGDVIRGVVPTPKPAPSKKPLSPKTVAQDLVDEIPVPAVVIHINPKTGLVGAESWFWFTGYNGTAMQRSKNYLGTLISVRATPSRYVWHFGDGTSLSTTSPGRAYPTRSDIRHTYQRSSLGRPVGYTVSVDFQFNVAYRVGNGSWQSLPPISRVASTGYPVRESQAVIDQ